MLYEDDEFDLDNSSWILTADVRPMMPALKKKEGVKMHWWWLQSTAYPMTTIVGLFGEALISTYRVVSYRDADVIGYTEWLALLKKRKVRKGSNHSFFIAGLKQVLNTKGLVGATVSEASGAISQS